MQVNKLNSSTYNANKTAFNGKISTESLGKKILSSKSFKKFSDKFEYDKFSMSLTAMMVLLYGATIIPRYLEATDKHDRREILTRDFLSITAILFFAKGLSKGFSKVFSKMSGFALNNTPSGHGKDNIFKKAWNYLNPAGGIDVLSSQELKLKYSNLKNYKNGIADFFKFIKEQGGDLKKVLSANKDVKKFTEQILGKSIKDSKIAEIETAFEKAKGSSALENIYKVFEDTNNSYVRKAKTMNSTFGFLSTVLLVPGFMIWLEKFNEKTTKKLIAKEMAAKEAKREEVAENESTPELNKVIKSAQNSSSTKTKETFAYFLGDKK